MNALSSGTEEITSESGQTIGSITTQTVTSQTFTNMAVIYSDYIVKNRYYFKIIIN